MRCSAASSGSSADVVIRTPAFTLPNLFPGPVFGPANGPMIPVRAIELDLGRVRTYSVGSEFFPTAKLGIRIAYTRLRAEFATQRDYIVDQTVAELEDKLDPARFVRIHRGVILNLDHLLEVHRGFGGRLIARLKHSAKIELTVSRDRVRILKEKLGL